MHSARLAASEQCAWQHPRVITTITIDDRKDEPHHLDEMILVVEKHLGHAAKQTGRRQLVREA